MRILTGKFFRKRPAKPHDPGQDRAKERPSTGPAGKWLPDRIARSLSLPESRPLSQPGMQRVVTLFLILIIIIASSVFCFIGPGASILEANLRKLAQQASLPATFTQSPSLVSTATTHPSGETPVRTATPTRSQKTPTLKVSLTPSGTATLIATATAASSPTPVPPENTPTPTSEVSGCVPASEVTLADVGKTLCVSGRVSRTIDKPASFLIIVVEEPEAFYFVAYDLKYDQLEEKQCVYAMGEIRQLGNNPIMVVSYSVPIQYCP